MSCVLAGSAEFRESDVGQAWVRRQLKRGDVFVTRSKTPYELDWKSPVGEELDFIIIHFSRVFKQATGMSPLQFVTRDRIVRAQKLIRETSRCLIEIALEVGYTSPSHFAQVFRRVVGVAPTEFRTGL